MKPKIRVIAVGSLKEPYLRAGEMELLSRLSAFTDISVVECPEARYPAKLSEASRLAALEKEGESVLKALDKGERLVALAIEGKLSSSNDLRLLANAPVAFAIGGSLGLGANALSRANCKISFSRLTFPHQLMRLMLLDALLRALGKP
ncbi:MAG: 23S rRNA (pseudouridine(1915)-N(3))-methyltransferase RlmH [Clostridiales bacterium]|nr:23S rRNA (pseudouridine(1915)-N(3))-methyltransferase RlmH [Clostridiales bacterium]